MSPMGVGLHLCNSARGGAAHALRARITDRLLKKRKILAENTESKVDGLESLQLLPHGVPDTQQDIDDETCC